MSTPTTHIPRPSETSVSVEQVRGRLRKKSQLKGRQPDHVSMGEVLELIGAGPHRRDLLIENLHKVNDFYRGLHERHLVALSRQMNVPMAEVFEVATFYHHFEVLRGDEEAAQLTVRVCDGLACELRGARDLLDRLPALLGTDVRVIPAPCVGRCEQAPVAVVGQAPVALADMERVHAAVSHGSSEHPAPPDDGSFDAAATGPAPITRADREVSPAYVGLRAYRAGKGYELATRIVKGELEVGAVIAAMSDSGLRGLGGAGFPTGRKWGIVRSQPAPRVMAVNIDEGEPGTFKDRVYLERDPHRFLEGLLIAANVVGTEAVYIYLRDEYHGCRAILQREIDRLVADPPFPLPLIELRRGAGAYICGEESAMIESIEGKRGEPRMRPPYIAQVGPVRQADARTQFRDALLGARHHRARPGLVQWLRPQWPQGAAFLQRQWPREGTGREARSRRHFPA